MRELTPRQAAIIAALTRRSMNSSELAYAVDEACGLSAGFTPMPSIRRNIAALKSLGYQITYSMGNRYTYDPTAATTAEPTQASL